MPRRRSPERGGFVASEGRAGAVPWQPQGLGRSPGRPRDWGSPLAAPGAGAVPWLPPGAGAVPWPPPGWGSPLPAPGAGTAPWPPLIF